MDWDIHHYAENQTSKHIRLVDTHNSVEEQKGALAAIMETNNTDVDNIYVSINRLALAMNLWSPDAGSNFFGLMLHLCGALPLQLLLLRCVTIT